MTNKFIVEKISGYLHTALRLLLDWVKPVFEQITPDWWKDLVLVHLKPNDLLNVPNKNIPSLENLDLAPLLIVTNRNLKSINEIHNINKTQRSVITMLIEVRNNWSHSNVDLPKKNIIEQDLHFIKDFFVEFNAPVQDINDIINFINQFTGMTIGNEIKTSTITVKKEQEKDYTKYKFNDTVGEYGKGRLVLEIVKDFIKKHPTYSFEELQTYFFPKHIQGSVGVINKYDDVMAKYEKAVKKRHFVNADDIIELKNGDEIVISTEWGITNIPEFINKVGELGYEIKEVK